MLFLFFLLVVHSQFNIDVLLSATDVERIELVLVYQLDRFSRNRYDSAIYRKELNKQGVGIESALENIANDASGIITTGLLETFAEYFSAQLSEKVTRGMYQNANKCKYNGGNITMGYRIDENQHYQIDPATAPIIKEIFERYAEGETTVAITSDLNARGIKTTKGKAFTKNSLQHILRNERYTGTYCFGDIKIKEGIPRIVSDELFEQVQGQLSKNRRSGGGRGKAGEEYLLSGKLFCGKCKDSMVGISGKSSGNEQIYRYYACSRKLKEHSCDKNTVRKDYIEQLIAQDCFRMLSDDNIKDIAGQVIEQNRNGTAQSEIDRMTLEIHNYERKIDKLIEALENSGAKALPRIEKRIEDNEKSIEELKKSIAIEKKKIIPITEEMIINAFSDLRAGRITSKKVMRTFINTLVLKVFLYDSHYNIYFNFSDNDDPLEKDYLLNIDRSLNAETDCVPRKALKFQRFKAFTFLDLGHFGTLLVSQITLCNPINVFFPC